MKILVTGSSGKLGKWAVKELRSHGHFVIGYDLLGPSQAADREIISDVEDLASIAAAVTGADAILHLAGVPTHGLLPDDQTFRINTMGAFNVHEAARRASVARVVSLSSEAVLGWSPGSWQRAHLPKYLPIHEDHPCEPQDCYGLSKVVLEAIGRSFTDRCGMVTVFLRASWIVSPDELEQLARNDGRPVTTFALCHYIDVRDLAVVCRLALEADLEGSHTLFVGSGETTVATPLAELYPQLAPAIADRAAALVGTRSSVSIARARQVLGWEPKYSWRAIRTAGSH
jgi:nucleoside-diphosphate-sugar epimerase